jgi:hypothetical protein
VEAHPEFKIPKITIIVPEKRESEINVDFDEGAADEQSDEEENEEYDEDSDEEQDDHPERLSELDASGEADGADE